MPVLTLTNLACQVPGRILFSGLNHTLEAGESVAVMGPSGSGKSTLISAILGMVKPATGRINVAGVEMSSAGPEKAAKARRKHIGVVFQSGELMPDLTAAENVAVALMLMKPSDTPIIELARDRVESLGVEPDTLAVDLSGGERQRVALARALATDPQLVLADEPTGALDRATRDKVAAELFDTVTGAGAALLLVTHDEEVAAMADEQVTLG